MREVDLAVECGENPADNRRSLLLITGDRKKERRAESLVVLEPLPGQL